MRLGSAFDSDGLRGQLGPVVQDDATRAVIRRDDPRDRRVDPELGARLPRRRRHRLGDRAHAPDHVAEPALDIVVPAREQVEQEPDRRAGPVGRACIPYTLFARNIRLIVSDSK